MGHGHNSRELAQKEQLDNNNNTFSYCPATERELYVYHFSIVGFNNHINNHIIDYIICHIIDHVNNFCSVSGDLKNVRAIVGGTVGGVAGFVALLLGAGLLWWRRRQRKYNSVELGEDYHVVNNQDNFNSAIITPYPDVMRETGNTSVVKGGVFTSPSPSNAGGSVVPSSSGSAPPSEAPRLQDAGPASMLPNRAPSGRLPPAYEDVTQNRGSVVSAIPLPGGGRAK